MSLATKADLLGKNKRRFRHVDLPGGLKVRIRSLTEKEQAEYEVACYLANRDRNAAGIAGTRSQLIALCVIGDDEKPMLTEADVQGMDHAVTQTILDACVEHTANRTSLEASTKNSEGIPAGDSPSA